MRPPGLPDSDPLDDGSCIDCGGEVNAWPSWRDRYYVCQRCYQNVLLEDLTPTVTAHRADDYLRRGWLR